MFVQFQGRAVSSGTFGNANDAMYRNDSSGCGENHATIILHSTSLLYFFPVAVARNGSNAGDSNDLLSGDQVCASSVRRMECGETSATCGDCGTYFNTVVTTFIQSGFFE